MKKRLLTFCVVLALAAGILAAPAAATGSGADSADHAARLLSLHLLQEGDIYQLDNSPTRLQGLTMLIRLLGLEKDALAYEGPSPFTDTASPYAAYARAKGLARGIGRGAFNPNGSLSARNFVVFLLRALGYDDSRGDFTVDGALSFAVSASLMTEGAAAQLASLTLNWGDMADLSFAALTCKMKGGARTLAEKLRDEGVFTQAEGEEAVVLGAKAGWVYVYTPKPGGGDVPAVSYSRKTVSVSGGRVTAHVVTVDPKRTSIRASLTNNSVGQTASFSQIVRQAKGAAAVINANPFDAYGAVKAPEGYVMAGGELLYGSPGLSSFGFTGDGRIVVGRPVIYARIRSGEKTWTANAVNTAGQGDGPVLYTARYSSPVAIEKNGFVMTVFNGKIAGYSPVIAGTRITVPGNGYLLYMDSEFASGSDVRQPTLGASFSVEYYLGVQDPEGFTLDGVTSVISGGPRLVQNGAIVTSLESGFQGSQFTTDSIARTAIGVDRQGQLLLVSVTAATIQQMRELMLDLGCVDALNLDGGASSGMYCRGTYYVAPSRQLAVTLQVFPK